MHIKTTSDTLIVTKKGNFMNMKNIKYSLFSALLSLSLTYQITAADFSNSTQTEQTYQLINYGFFCAITATAIAQLKFNQLRTWLHAPRNLSPVLFRPAPRTIETEEGSVRRQQRDNNKKSE